MPPREYDGPTPVKGLRPPTAWAAGTKQALLAYYEGNDAEAYLHYAEETEQEIALIRKLAPHFPNASRAGKR